jgi:hypothetical protein
MITVNQTMPCRIRCRIRSMANGVERSEKKQTCEGEIDVMGDKTITNGSADPYYVCVPILLLCRFPSCYAVYNIHESWLELVQFEFRAHRKERSMMKTHTIVLWLLLQHNTGHLQVDDLPNGGV